MANSELHALLELLATPFTDPRTLVLFVLLVAAAMHDVRSYRIPNWLTGGGLAFALIYTALVPPVYNAAWTWAPAGMLLGFAALLPLYLLRAMGAGDVKLMAMTGAFLGLQGTVFALLFTFVTAGLAAFAYAAWHGVTRRMLGNTRRMLSDLAVASIGGAQPALAPQPGQSVGRLAYGVSIAAGTIASVFAAQLGLI